MEKAVRLQKGSPAPTSLLAHSGSPSFTVAACWLARLMFLRQGFEARQAFTSSFKDFANCIQIFKVEIASPLRTPDLRPPQPRSTCPSLGAGVQDPHKRQHTSISTRGLYAVLRQVMWHHTCLPSFAILNEALQHPTCCM